MRKLFISTIICIYMICGFTPIYAEEPYSSYSEIELRKDTYKWHFKNENGHLYKRLWNETKERWETDWIKVQ